MAIATGPVAAGDRAAGLARARIPARTRRETDAVMLVAFIVDVRSAERVCCCADPRSTQQQQDNVSANRIATRPDTHMPIPAIVIAW